LREDVQKQLESIEGGEGNFFFLKKKENQKD